MDSLKSLMDKKQYDLVIKLTEHAKDNSSLFYRISSFLALNKGEAALDCIKNNRKALQANLFVLIKIHLEILCILEKFDEAYDELKYYENLPYESQVVEELLKQMPEYIRNEERKAFRQTTFSDEQIIKMLNSNVANDVLMGLDIVRKRELNNFTNAIKNVLVNNPKQSVRSFALMLLVENKYKLEVDFKHIDNIIKVIPSDLNPPFIGEKFNSFSKRLSLELKDPSLAENALQIYSGFIIYSYPSEDKFNEDEMLLALRFEAEKYLQVKDMVDLEKECLKHSLEIENIRKIINLLDDSLNNF